MDKIAALKLRNPDVLIHTIGHRLRRQRLAKGMTQQELAERSGVCVSTLKLMEQQGKGSLQRLAKIAVVLDLDGDLRSLFSGQRTFDSLDAVERTKRQRAPQRRFNDPVKDPVKRRVNQHLVDHVADQLAADSQPPQPPRSQENR